MLRESKEFSGSVEGIVKFEEETCCALARAFDQNPEVAKQLGEIVGERDIKLFRDILSNSLDPNPKINRIKFVPSDKMKTAYSQIAKKELERIEAKDEDDEDLNCEHTVDEHRKALELVFEKMQSAVN